MSAARKRRVVGALVLAGSLLFGCSRQPEVGPASFVGKWQSTRLDTPLYLSEAGGWEVRREDGKVLEYGAWEFRDKTIVWSFKADGEFGQDKNAVLSVKPREFRLRERDGSVTTFTRLD